ncbi:MAG: hypothetical protein QN196_10860 [Armatimonadota bacterium]|nr:hypothetical protein [Armatimonadota bacterium]MDR7410025.1 hypothetical protein [Armatimonadota bacterium]MDR7442944.1 hypothetical protein [Armatimonadota bacterium]
MDPDESNPVAALESASAADVLSWCVMLLAHQARVYLGLIPGKTQGDLEQARLVIDAAGALTDLLQNHLQGDRLTELLMHVADLRLNYLEATRRQ